MARIACFSSHAFRLFRAPPVVVVELGSGAWFRSHRLPIHPSTRQRALFNTRRISLSLTQTLWVMCDAGAGAGHICDRAGPVHAPLHLTASMTPCMMCGVLMLVGGYSFFCTDGWVMVAHRHSARITGGGGCVPLYRPYPTMYTSFD